MEKKTASAIMLTLLLTSMLTLAFNIQPAKAASETIIDTHGDSRFTKYPSGPYWWSVADHDAFHTRAYNNNFWYTYCGEEGQGELYFGTWYQSLTQSDVYEVFVWIPNPDPFGTYTPTQNARYQIYHKDGMTERTVNQRLRTGGWYSVGTYTFDTSLFVILNDRTGEPYLSTMIAFDAIKFVYIPPVNNPPYTPYNPYPSPHATGVPITADLSWSGGDPDVGDTVTYDVYFGISPSPPLVSSGQSATTYNLPTLSYVTTYYWKIVSRDNHGLTTNGPLWDFTTEPQPPQPKTLTVYSSPSGVSFTANGVSHTTPWSGTYSQGTSVNLVMPSVYSGGDVRYYWDKWSDGVTNSSRTIVLNSDTTVTGNYIGPYYELVVASSPISGIPFTIDGASKTTLYSEWLYQGYYTIEMPATYNEYSWQQWLEDGDTNRIKTVSLTTSTILTAVYLTPSEPLEITTTSGRNPDYGIYSARTTIHNRNPQSYSVTYRFLTASDQILSVPYYVHGVMGTDYIIPDNPFVMPPSKTAFFNFVFDPRKTSDLSDLINAKLKIEYLTESGPIVKYEPLNFETYESVATTNFNMTRDAYSFSNNEWTGEGKCYGMASTSILYFEGKIPLPQGRTTYSLQMAEAQYYVDAYQDSYWLNQWSTGLIGRAGNVLAEEKYSLLKQMIQKGEPMIFIMSKQDQQGKTIHAVTAYKILETETTAYIIVYDNIWSYAYQPYDTTMSFRYMTYDFGSKQLKYEDYSDYKLVEAKKDPWWRRIEIGSAGELRAYDSENRITGVVGGEVRQEIPLSLYDSENKAITIFCPDDVYRYVVAGISNGSYGLRMTSAENETTTSFSATDIPLHTTEIHQYLVDWVMLLRGEDGVTVEVDSGGDGIFEYTFTSDSELTRNEFLIQTGQSALYTFSILWGAETFTVSVESNSTVSEFVFSQPDKEISFNVSGEAGIGFCNVTIPKALLYGEPWTVLMDGASVSSIITENATHTSLYFTYTHSTHTIQIIGTWVIAPPPPPTYSLTITTTVGGTTDPAPGTYTYTANSSVQVTAIPNANYLFDHWELDTVNAGSANPYTVLMDNNHTLKAVFTYSPPPPPLSASISPLSASILVGQSVTFTSTVSGGYTPYSYQWYLNGAPVSGATSNTWIFTPTTGGIYYIYLKVTDAKANTAQSDTARITVATVPVGGYSIPIERPATARPVLPYYIALIATLTAVFTKLRPKTKRKH